MGQAITLAAAIEMWRAIISAVEGSDADDGDMLIELERRILSAPVVDHHHAAAICDILEQSIGGGERSDGCDVEAARRLGDWHRRLATVASADSLSPSQLNATLTIAAPHAST